MTNPSPSDVNISPCEREKIHTPGAIQPYGLLMVLSEPDMKILQVSENVYEFLGIAAAEILDNDFGRYFDQKLVAQIQDYLQHSRINKIPLYIADAHFPLIKDKELYRVILHRCNEALILEFEPGVTEPDNNTLNYCNFIRQTILDFGRKTDFKEFLQAVAGSVKLITGFDRVMIYKFNESGDGQIIVDNRELGMESFEGLHYPASDIPMVARELYLKNCLRLIPTVNYTPSKLIPEINPEIHHPLDMTYVTLRDVSKIHLQYLKNMGVSASASITLTKGGKLWGLILAHHRSPFYMEFELRTVCEFIGQYVSLHLAEKENLIDVGEALAISEKKNQLIRYLVKSEKLNFETLEERALIYDFINAHGAAIMVEGEIILVGQTPSKVEVQDLGTWLATVIGNDTPIFQSHELSKDYPAARNFKDKGSGLLAVCLSQSMGYYLVWFRQEIIQTVDWAGNPTKPFNSIQGVLTPRNSFALWQEKVSNTSLPWRPVEIAAIRKLREAIIELILNKAQEIIKMDDQLRKSNADLDSFAYATSHDLKEPLRGIYNYSKILMRDYSERLDEAGKLKLERISGLTQRMESLINSLLSFAQISRVKLGVKETNLARLVDNVLELFKAQIDENQVEVNITKPLPALKCHAVGVGQIFNNLIANAIKYNNHEKTYIEIGWSHLSTAKEGVPREYLFYVKDNGIGIAENQYDNIFQIFKQLHPKSRYGEGTGVGLAIVKKLVERHGGRIWLESKLGEGTTFFFTLKEE